MSQIASGSQDNTRNTKLDAIPADVLSMAIPTETDIIYKICSQNVGGVSPQKRELLAQLVANAQQR